MTASVVIGLGFGDEGKGNFVNNLCLRLQDSLVIRFSGGHQSSHTVVNSGKRHVFSNFGSGTLLRVPTFWSKFCTVDPVGFVNEHSVLFKNGFVDGYNPKIFIDERCPITTPYDIHYNQNDLEGLFNGTCGVGFGVTIEREQKLYSLTFGDLFYQDVFMAKLESIKKYYIDKGVPTQHVDLTKFLSCAELILNLADKVYGMPRDFENYIFEGSQGLMLDQNFGIYPNVTWANTGFSNVVSLGYRSTPYLYLVTRAYQTRHGNGFMTNEDIPHNIKEDIDETNVANKYQGKLRRSLLNVSLLEYAINKDVLIRESKFKNLVITCLDHIVNEYRYTYNGEIINCSNEEDFIARIARTLKIKDVYISKSNESSAIERRLVLDSAIVTLHNSSENLLK